MSHTRVLPHGNEPFPCRVLDLCYSSRLFAPRYIFARTADYPSPPRVRGGRAQHNPGYLRLWVAGVPVAVVASWVSAAATCM